MVFLLKRVEARKQGLKVFFTGKKCKRGHLCNRYVSTGSCLECSKIKVKEWSQNNRNRLNELATNWRRKNPDKAADCNRKARGGIPESTTHPKPHKCESCGKVKKLHWDHDHSTGLFRGWLCHRCNVLVGFLEKDPVSVLMAKEYMSKYEKRLQSISAS